MTDFSKMSDFEINEAVSMALLSQSKNPEAKYVAIGNYCNSWADAGPIAEKMKIAIYPRKDGGWIAQGFENCIAVIDDNPCRAICTVFLMMNERSLK